MVTVKPRKETNGKDMVQVNIMTRGGTQTNEDLFGECSTNILVESKIKKVAQPPPRFH